MKTHFTPIYKQIWLVFFMNCLYELAFHINNSLPLGPIWPSPPSTKELHGVGVGVGPEKAEINCNGL